MYFNKNDECFQCAMSWKQDVAFDALLDSNLDDYAVVLPSFASEVQEHFHCVLSQLLHLGAT